MTTILPRILPSSLRTIMRAGGGWLPRLCEFIDNSYDADARSVRLEILQTGEGHVRVTDDGAGVADMAAFTELGKHVAHATTRSGRYGAGAKNAALWIGKEETTLEVQSVYRGHGQRISVPWREWFHSNEWLPPVQVEEFPGQGRGTVVHVAPICGRPDVPALIPKLAFTYSPALQEGRTLTVVWDGGSVECEPWTLPRLDAQLETELVLESGKRAFLRCGVVAGDAPNNYPGLTYRCGFRVVNGPTAAGCASGRSISRFCGTVDLDSSWGLTSDKTGISDEDEDELYGRLEELTQPILAHAQETAFDISIQSTLDALNARFAGIPTRQPRDPNSKAKRSKAENHTGSVSPTGTGSKHTRAAVEQEGKTFTGRTIPAFRVDKWDADNKSWGEYDPVGVVRLNIRVPLIASRFECRDVDFLGSVAIAIAHEAIAIAGNGRGGQLEIVGLDQPLGDALWSLLTGSGGQNPPERIAPSPTPSLSQHR